MADKKLIADPTYYRSDPFVRGNLPLKPEQGSSDAPVPDGKTFGEANTATAGPLRALFGKGVREFEIPCALSPAGIINRAVQVVRNDYDKPMYARIRLARNSTEGRVGIAVVSSINGSSGGQPMEWVDLTQETGQKYEVLLLSGNAVFMIGTWAGIVPLSVFVTVAAWNP